MWQDTGELHSIMCAASSYDGRTLVAYADILFDAGVVQQLLASTADITLLVDTGFAQRRLEETRQVDLVTVDRPPARRVLNGAQGRKVLQIGKNLEPDGSNAEFCGIALFSADGFELLKSVYADVSSTEGRFHEAESIARASLTDLLQEVIDRGHTVSCTETSGGWMEIRSFEDYMLAGQMCS
jgi:phosphoenolpyruvate phosphomutase